MFAFELRLIHFSIFTFRKRKTKPKTSRPKIQLHFEPKVGSITQISPSNRRLISFYCVLTGSLGALSFLHEDSNGSEAYLSYLCKHVRNNLFSNGVADLPGVNLGVKSL